MRYLITALLLLLCATSAQAGVFVGFGQEAPAGYSDVIFYWNADSTTAQKSSGDTSATAQAGATIDTTTYHNGTGSVAIDGAYRRFDFTLNNDDIADMETGRVGIWAYVSATTMNWAFLNFRYDNSNYIRLSTFGTSRIYFDYVAGGSGPTYTGTGNSSFPSNEWFFLEFAWNKGGAGNDFQIFINGSLVASDDTTSGTWSKGAGGTFSIGDYDGNASAINSYYIDQVIISNDPTRDLYALRNNTSF